MAVIPATFISSARNASSAAFTTAKSVGIVIIHQELALVPLLSIAENIFLGNEQARYGVIDWNLVRTPRGRAACASVGLREDPDTLITNIGVGKQQLVEIAKALSKEVKLLILDEPTASLSEKDSDALLDAAGRVQAAGHCFDPDLAQAQRGRQGRRPHHRPARRQDHRDARPAPRSARTRIITSMVGRTLDDRYPARTPNIGETIFEVRNWVGPSSASMPTAR